MKVSGEFVAALRERSAALPPALADARREALDVFAQQGFPTVRDEDWKYTNLDGIADHSATWLARSQTGSGNDADARLDELRDRIDAHWIVIAEGRVGRLPETDSSGPDLSLLSEASTGGDALSEEPAGALDALNMTLLDDGLAIRVAAGRRVARPVAVLVSDSIDGGVSQARLRVTLEAGASLTLIEWHTSRGTGAHYNNTVTRLRLGNDAECHYLRLQDRAVTHSQTHRLDVRLGQDARLRHGSFDLGGRLSRADVDIDIGNTAASALLNGLYLVGPGQHVDNHTRIDHRVGPAFSSQEYRGILGGRSRAVWNGKAVVGKGADGTDAQQANHNLLLGDGAEIDAKPELEIYADDVKCSHGTTVGQLDRRALFYLQSRGIDADAARRMLTRAFAAEIVARAPVDGAAEWLEPLIDARLEALVEAAPQ